VVRIGSHPQIPTVISTWQTQAATYLVQQFISGQSLADSLTHSDPYREPQIWQILLEILPVLDWIHQHDVIHGDVQPANLIRQQGDYRLCLVNFGLARCGSYLLSHPGSPEYIAPEQAEGNPCPASDLYSLGLTCSQLLTGLPPFDLIHDWQDWLEALSRSGEVSCSDLLRQILSQLMQTQVSQRFASVAAVQRSMGQRVCQTRGSEIPTDGWICQQTLTVGSGVTSLAWVGSDRLASAGEDKVIRLWDLATGQLLQRFPTQPHTIRSLEGCPWRDQLISGSEDGRLILWDPDSAQPIHAWIGHDQAIKAVKIHPTQPAVLSSSWDKTLRLWHLPAGELIWSVDGHRLGITAVAWSPDGQSFASASLDRTVKVWRVISNLARLGQPQVLHTLSAHTWAVKSVAWSPDGRWLASGGEDNTIHLWDPHTGSHQLSLRGHSWAVTALTFSSDSSKLYSGSWDKTIQIWQVSTGEQLGRLIGHSESITSLILGQEDQLLISGSQDQTIRFWHFPHAPLSWHL
jgi:WD40 repeat protein